jgi:uncharacterized membrane protein
MVKIKRWLLKDPIWVCLFVVLTQLLLIPSNYFEMDGLAASIAEFGESPSEASLKARFQDHYHKLRQQIFMAFVVSPVASGLAFWKWSQEKTIGSAMPDEHQTIT